MGKAKAIAAALTLSAAGLFATATREGGFIRSAYLDPVGIPTICAGHTATARIGQAVSTRTCERLLKEDTAEAQAAVQRLVKVPITQRQYDELVDFTFNVGQGNLATSTLLKKVNAGDCWGAGSEFPKWRYAKGQELNGLLIRRNKNREGWESGC